jgi:hypothetical protein
MTQTAMGTYALTDLEGQSAMSRRTISDYVSKGLLSGPSHRGRGARYPQRDLDALRIIPRLRTVMKNEYPGMEAVRSFLGELSPADVHRIARLPNERVFETEVRRLRIRNRVRTSLPNVSPERIESILEGLTPEQVRGVDLGQYQLSAILDMKALSVSPARPASLPMSGSNDPAASRAPQLQLVQPDPDFAAQDNAPWAKFQNPNVEIRIDRDALRSDVSAGLPRAIRDLAQEIENFLKASANTDVGPIEQGIKQGRG